MMPILKSLRMPDPKGTRANTLPLTPSRNPFESSSGAEDEEEKGELDAFRGESIPTLPNGASCHRRATLEKLVGLSPFRLVRGGGRRVGSPGDGESRSFLGRVLGPGVRRSSADFGLLARLNGARQGGTGDAEAAGEAARRLAFLRLGRGPKPRRGSLAERLMPSGEPALGTSPPAPAPPKVKEPLSVLEILSLIQKRELARADEHILELEAEEKLVTSGSSPGSLGEVRGLPEGRRARDVTLLYEALQRELWALVRETLADPGATGGTGGAPLTQLGQVLAQEEEADGRRGPGAARRFRARWAEVVGQAAGERLEAAARGEAEAMTGRLEALRSRLLADMGAVRTRLAPAYPPSLGAFGVYLRGYHGALSDWLRKATYHWLPLADRYALLYWHNQVYPREILGLVNMVALENGQLGPLLPTETVRSLEDECVTDVKAQTRAALLQTLQDEEEQWIGAEDQPSSLAQDVCELLEEHTDQAPRISQEFGERMAHCCLGGLAEFLQSFQQRVERFHENPSVRELPSDSYISRTITLVNCGPPLRALAERLARVGPSESEPAREAAASALDRVTRLCHRVLADLLFQELQPHFSKLMRRKWLTSSEALDGIVGTLGAQALALRRMHDRPYQALVGELHRRALVEYVRPLLRGRLRCRSARSRNRVAGRLRDEAAQLQRLFRRLESQASWLDAVVPHLAEVLQLEDTPSIQVEVGVLVRDYPDIRRKHVAALLDVRGLRSAAARHEILAVARDLEQSGEGAPAPPRDRAFFADIPIPRSPFCLGLPLPLARLPLTRLTRPDLACLPRPRPRPTARPRAQP